MIADSSAWRLQNLTEAELAALRQAEGASVAFRAGHHWAAIFPGFYQPVNLVAGLEAPAIGRPTQLCWGFRAGLADASRDAATGSIAVHLYRDIGRFDRRALSAGRRDDLRRCRRALEIVQPAARILVDQGYGVFRSAQDRLHYWRDAGEETYRRRIEKLARDPRRFILAGVADGRLAGYLESYAVDGVLYTEHLIVATAAVRTGIATGLFVAAMEAAAQHSDVRMVCLGQHTPERPGLTSFKDGLRAPVEHLPARSMIPRAFAAFIRARRPAAYYRLTGINPHSR